MNDANTPVGDGAQAVERLKPHPAADIFPLMINPDFDALVDDIRKNGQLDPIVLHAGMILDGRHRYKACTQLGIEPITTEWSGEGTVENFVISKNLHRRHLNSAQKRELIAKLLKLAPEKSNRQIAAGVGADDKTVGSVRSGLEATAEIPQLNWTVGADGKSRTARPKSDRAKDPRRHLDDPDFQAEADAAARDLEIERDERIALTGADALAAENENLRKQVYALDRRVSALMEENAGLKHSEKTWKTRALRAGWKAARFDA